MRLYERGDFDIHAKPTTWEYDKYIHLIISMNVSLLAVCYLILALVSICIWRNVWGCARAWGKNWESDCKREKASEVEDYIGIHETRLTPNQRYIFARDKIKMLRCSWNYSACLYSVQSGSRNYLIYRGPTTFVLGKKGILDPLFGIFSTPHAHRRTFKKYECKSYITLSCRLIYMENIFQ